MPVHPEIMDKLLNITETQEHKGMRVHNRPQVSCDTRCYDLAINFLKANALAYPDYGRELGAEIQELIETWIEDKQDQIAGYDPRNDPLDHDYSMND